MRTALLVAAAFALASLAPFASALLPGACTNASTTTATNFAWSPGCLRIVSGDTVTFGNADTSLHNARSTDDAAALRLLAPACFVTPNMNQGGTVQVRFTHDTDSLSASVRNADGTWGPVNDCLLAEDPLTIASSEAAIPFECGIHQTMTGRILVQQLG